MRVMKNKRGMGRPTISLMRNRRGWIEIVEAFVAVMLVAGVLLVLLNRGSLQKTDVSNSIYDTEVSILREIQTNNTLRTVIVNIPEPMPVEWEDSRFPPDIKNKIILRTPDYLDCVGKICRMNETCSLEENKGKDIYSQSVVISSTLQEVSYKQLNIFCWTK
jgi:hypothetical protein